MAAKKKTIPVIPVADLGLPEEARASQIAIVALEAPAAKQAGKTIPGTPEEAAAALVSLLRTEAKVI
jgi:electron transfer flavoprotein beta subunit